MLLNHLIFCHLLLLLPSIFSSIRVFSNESALHQVAKVASSGASASASVLSELISFRITGLISLLSKGLYSITIQKASILWHSAFFTVQLSHPYMTTGKTIALTIGSFISKVMALILICCLGSSQLFFQGASILILWLQSPSPVILELKKIKSVIISTFSPSICHEVIRLDDAMIFVF